MNKSLIAALIILFCLPVRADFVLIGDSISDWRGGWADILQDEGVRVRSLTQPGRSIRDFELPRDIKADPKYYDHAVYFLGTNDIWQNAYPHMIEASFLAHINGLERAGFSLTVIAPPIFSERDGSSRAVRRLLYKHKAKSEVSPGYKLVDTKNIWHSVNTMDGIHPTDDGHRALADFLKRKI